MTNYRNQDPYGNRRQGDRRDYSRGDSRGIDRDGSYGNGRANAYDRARANAYERMRRSAADDREMRTPREDAHETERMRHSSRAAMRNEGYDRPARPENRQPRNGYGYADTGADRMSSPNPGRYSTERGYLEARDMQPGAPQRSARNAYASRDPERNRPYADPSQRIPRERAGYRADSQRTDAPARRQKPGEHPFAGQEREAERFRQPETRAPRSRRAEYQRTEAAPTERPYRNRAASETGSIPAQRTQEQTPANAVRNRRAEADKRAALESAAQKTASTAAEAGKKAGAAAERIGKGGAALAASAASFGAKVSAWAKKTEYQAKEKSEHDRKEIAAEAAKAANDGNEFNLDSEKLGELAVWHNRAAKAFGIILTCGMVLGLLLFLRPSVSQNENRELTKFPQFSVSDFVSGAYTEGISTWYADTYPFRDQLIAVNQAFKGLYGFESDTQMFGGATKADDIPDEAAKKSQKKDPVAPETYDSFNLEEDIQGQIMQGLYVDKGSVYATYGFTQEAADDYVNALNGAADKLEGTTQVYSILIPNNSGILLSKDELAALGGSNQGQAIQYYYDSYNDKVKTVPTMKPLLDHKDEYLYFRTDHHWTSLAAYYVYKEFCNQKGIEPHNIDEYEEKDFAPFLGSYYSQLQLESLTNDPDTVQAWIPKGTNDLKYTDVDGNTIDWNVIKDVSDWDQGTQYNCFVGGDQPWAEIHNPQITDGSSCLVVKESYGNAFIPWLVDHYENVYIVDFRYNNNNVVDICKEKGVNDLIFLNNISIIGSVDVAGKIQSLL